MNRKKRMTNKNSGGLWTSLSRSRIFLFIVLVCCSSVCLNVFLLLFRNINLTKIEKYEGESSHGFDKWANVVDYEDAATHSKFHPTKTPHKGQNKQSEGRKNNGNAATTNVIQINDETASRNPRKGDAMIISKTVTFRNEKLPKCPSSPPGLVGPLRAMSEDVEPAILRIRFADMEKGGRTRPLNCVPRERVAIIIPFRNRHSHLHICLHNLIPFLQRQMADATIFIIEQAPPTTFNRGALLNIGFLEAMKVARFDCFILHDVDLIPLNDHNLYRCGKNPRHYAVAMNKFRFSLKYTTYFGGVVGFSREQYLRVNGNSNLYFGWGGEDDDLWNRTINKNYTVDRYDNITSRYRMIKHTRDKGNDKNMQRQKLLKSGLKRQDIEGLNTVKYKVNSIELDTIYTWINVSLDMAQIIETAPDYTRHDIWKLLKDLKITKKKSRD